METNATRMCALLVGLPDVAVIGVDDWLMLWLRIVIETPASGPPVVVGSCIATASARWSWWICRCSAAQPDWCGASNDGDAPVAVVAGATRILRSVLPGVR